MKLPHLGNADASFQFYLNSFLKTETVFLQLFDLETPSRSTINVQLPMLCIIEQLADFPQIKSQLHQGTHLDQYPQPFSDQQEASFPIDMSRISLQMRQIAQGLCLVRIDDIQSLKYIDFVDIE
ncbi:Hypothetical_protein [Hexamita inflata]|uniref:Hypothetical_protein n=1 Tax=Hexamita inflata TaxID=28002 RepID=A0AA86QXF1_9EUKA|nr:Hypothetical protein HINF_LOCUS55459 [Hexamita inflata]